MSNSVSKETMADNSGVSNSMRGHKGGVVGNGVGNDWGVDGVVGDGVGNHGSVDSVVGDGVGDDGSVDGVSHNWGSVDSVSEVGSVGGVASQDNSSVADGGVRAHVRGGGSSSKSEEGGDDESLKSEANIGDVCSEG